MINHVQVVGIHQLVLIRIHNTNFITIVNHSDNINKCTMIFLNILAYSYASCFVKLKEIFCLDQFSICDHMLDNNIDQFVLNHRSELKKNFFL